MKKLQEAIKTFDVWVSKDRELAARREYEEQAKSQEGQLNVLAAASNGDTAAADYLFVTLKLVIAKAFWKYFLGPDRKSVV